MRVLFLGQPLNNDDFARWALEAFREIERASYEDIAEVADAYTVTGTLTETRSLDVDTPTAANIAAVLGTLLTDLKKRGVNKEQ
ncbi:MAG: hypothetical protein WC807_14840 [Hyphomicrobium sp.]